MHRTATKTLFLPGAGGSADFWKPVAETAGMEGAFFAWPGLGDEPAHPDIGSLDDLIDMVADQITEPVNIVAQSMGGVVAIQLALAMPHLVARLVLAVTSGGVPVSDFGSSDWRRDYFVAFPKAALWIAEPVEDLLEHIPSIKAPTLLLWGENDPISPVAVGERLQRLLPNSRLCIIPGADHDLARPHVEAVAELIKQHLAD